MTALALPVHAQVNYPAELQGIWTTGKVNQCKKDSKAPPGQGAIILNFKGKNLTHGESDCTATNIKGSSGNYAITSKCEGEGETWKNKTTYKVEGSNLTWTQDGETMKFKKCHPMK